MVASQKEMNYCRHLPSYKQTSSTKLWNLFVCTMANVRNNSFPSDILFVKMSYTKLRAKDKCRISLNWRQGRYSERICTTRIKYMPWQILESDTLWVSRGRKVVAFQRTRHGLKQTNMTNSIPPSHVDDISRFVKTDDLIITGGKDKLICGWSVSLKKSVFCQKSNHSLDIQGLDCKRNALVTGSKDGTVKVWRLESEPSLLQYTQTLPVSDRVWCVALDPLLSWVASGSAGHSGVHPLLLFDLERGIEMTMNKCMVVVGAAIFDIKWECPNTLVTCGHDTTIRLWDIRVGDSVSCWRDPFGAPGYCLATDKQNTIICGTAHHGRVQLWDKRTTTSLQAYFGVNTASSPVYSVAFDPCELFIAQDSCINVLDFSVYGGPIFDYRMYCLPRPRT